MPNKSRHGKRKRPSLSKRMKERQHSLTTATQQPETAQIFMPTFSAGKVDSKARTSAPPTTPADQYAYVAAELKRIGILTGIILVILIVLALVLR